MDAWLPRVLAALALAGGGLLLAACSHASDAGLPPPSQKGAVSVEEALASRRTWRSFADQALSRQQLSQLLWAAYGVTARRHGLELKTAPSAGALYPLDVYAVVGADRVENLAAGCYHYRPGEHGLAQTRPGDLRRDLAQASHGQAWMAKAPVIIVITGEYQRCTGKYGQRGVVYTHIEAGHAGQNVFLQAEALGLRAGIVGAFDNRRLAGALGLPAAHEPLLAMPVGRGE
ncbi:MAG: SagB family peptide dehydrogenase [Thermodesulfobacteriota bacterium]